MRYLAIDVGARRTGLAVGDDGSGIVSPLHVIETKSVVERDRQVAVAVRDEEPDAIVLGLPLNMDGTDGPAAKAMRALAVAWAKRFGLPVHLHDERLSSAAADERMARTGLTYGQKKQRRDALAAAAILQRFLDEGGAGA